MPAIPAICAVAPNIAPLTAFTALLDAPDKFCFTFTVAVYTLPLNVFNSSLILRTVGVAASLALIITVVFMAVCLNLSNVPLASFNLLETP